MVTATGIITRRRIRCFLRMVREIMISVQIIRVVHPTGSRGWKMGMFLRMIRGVIQSNGSSSGSRNCCMINRIMQESTEKDTNEWCERVAKSRRESFILSAMGVTKTSATATATATARLQTISMFQRQEIALKQKTLWSMKPELGCTEEFTESSPPKK